MKLIRLESDIALTKKSNFTNYMSMPLQIKPRSKICLKCITIQFSSPPLIIDSSNDMLSVQANVGSPVSSSKITVYLERKQYLTIEDLCSEIQFKLNSALQSYYINPTDPDVASVGLEFLVSGVTDPTSNGVKVTIAFNRADVFNPAQTDFEIADTVEVVGTNYQKKATAPNTGKFNGSIAADDALNEGGWLYGMTIKPQVLGQVEVIGNSVWRIQVVQNSTDSLLHAVGCDGDGLYKFWYDNQWNESAIQVEEQDTINVCKNIINGTDVSVWYMITKEGATNPIIVAGDDTKDLPHALVEDNILSVQIANDTGKIAFNTIYFIPTTNQQNLGGVVSRKLASMVQTVHRNKNLSTTASNLQIVLSGGLARLLGYKNPILTKNAISGSWTAEEDVTTNFFDNDFIVTIPELPLAGYNHGNKRIENMIAVITSSAIGKSTNATGFERYEMSWEEMANFVFVSVGNNQNSISVPSLTIEVKSNGQLLEVDGKMSCLLLLQEDEQDK